VFDLNSSLLNRDWTIDHLVILERQTARRLQDPQLRAKRVRSIELALNADMQDLADLYRCLPCVADIAHLTLFHRKSIPAVDDDDDDDNDRARPRLAKMISSAVCCDAMLEIWQHHGTQSLSRLESLSISTSSPPAAWWRCFQTNALLKLEVHVFPAANAQTSTSALDVALLLRDIPTLRSLRIVRYYRSHHSTLSAIAACRAMLDAEPWGVLQDSGLDECSVAYRLVNLKERPPCSNCAVFLTCLTYVSLVLWAVHLYKMFVHS
jgi:hypothetical protein